MRPTESGDMEFWAAASFQNVRALHTWQARLIVVVLETFRRNLLVVGSMLLESWDVVPQHAMQQTVEGSIPLCGSCKIGILMRAGFRLGVLVWPPSISQEVVIYLPFLSLSQVDVMLGFQLYCVLLCDVCVAMLICCNNVILKCQHSSSRCV